MSTQKELDVLFPIGTVLIVKEPTYKRAAVGSNSLIRIDSPTDVLFPAPSDPLIRDLKWKVPLSGQMTGNRDFKKEGNSYFARQQYRLAEKLYSDGIAASPDPQVLLLLHLNRSAANLHLKQYRSAHRDAVKVLSLLEADEELRSSSVKEKALLRRARAEEGMRIDLQALASYQATLDHSSSNKEAQEGKARVERKLRESATGDYDWLGMYEKALHPEEYPEQDVGDYVGPMVIKTTSQRGGGRGVFATRDIKAGEIILVEKAFAAEWPSPRRHVVCLNLHTNVADTACQVAVVSSISAKLMDDGSLASKVNSLYGGPTMSSPEEVPHSFKADLDDDISVCVDTARLEAICTYNS